MRVAAVVLAAGRSSRYRAAGGVAPSKMLDVTVTGEPLIRSPVRAALAAGLSPVVVVTGHAGGDVAAALAGMPVDVVSNPDFATGLASSLRAGLAALAPEVEAAVVLLGDMPLVEGDTVARLVDALRSSPGCDAPACDAVVPVQGGERGNPVVLARRLFGPAMRLGGDEGARRLLRDPGLRVREVATDDDAVRRDLDEPGGLARS